MEATEGRRRRKKGEGRRRTVKWRQNRRRSQAVIFRYPSSVSTLVLCAGDDKQSELHVAEAVGDEFMAQVSHTMHRADFPQLFSKVGDACFSMFYPGNGRAGELVGVLVGVGVGI
ncbi:hypothetical protein E2C01_032140 [Portunus trituberculatus]|uniref:Uncharacterized protein n=1 Tax=Portunus trituberculatus TaxID=210409 RepID=A0A5B7F059_PORTR|nr:hypothetical protein [Portunus trituberculatus]